MVDINSNHDLPLNLNPLETNQLSEKINPVLTGKSLFSALQYAAFVNEKQTENLSGAEKLRAHNASLRLMDLSQKITPDTNSNLILSNPQKIWVKTVG